MAGIQRALLVFLAITSTGCSHLTFGRQPIDIEAASDSASDQKSVYVVGHGWHTGLILRPRDIPAEAWPDAELFEEQDFIEVGWGDAGFYQAKSITLPLILDALLLPSGSVVHVAGIKGQITKFFPVSDLVEVPLSDSQYDRLCRSIAQSFDRNNEQELIGLGPGLYGESQFFQGRGLYYFPKTCNVWTAQQLHAAGCPIWLPSIASTAGGVLSRARGCGRVIQESPRGLMFAALRGSDD